MKIIINLSCAEGALDTKTMKLTDLPAIAVKHEKNAELAISDGWNLTIAEIKLGDVDSSNTLCREIVRRFNEFPEGLKL